MKEIEAMLRLVNINLNNGYSIAPNGKMHLSIKQVLDKTTLSDSKEQAVELLEWKITLRVRSSFNPEGKLIHWYANDITKMFTSDELYAEFLSRKDKRN